MSEPQTPDLPELLAQWHDLATEALMALQWQALKGVRPGDDRVAELEGRFVALRHATLPVEKRETDSELVERRALERSKQRYEDRKDGEDRQRSYAKGTSY